MGIQQFLSEIIPGVGRPIDLRWYSTGIQESCQAVESEVQQGLRRRLRVALDLSSWIYKACVGYSDMLGDERHLTNYGRAELHLRNEGLAQPVAPLHDPESVKAYVTACAKSVIDQIMHLQKSTNMELLVVIDGATPPIKAREVRDRSLRRQVAETARDEPVELTGDEGGRDRRIRAYKRAGAGVHYQDVIANVIEALRENLIPFLVAPYESDGQLAFLSLSGLVDLIITEDSDLIAYGAHSILYKLSDPLKAGDTTGILIQRQDLAANPGKLNLADFSNSMLATMFVSVGSDYCSKLKGIGVVMACNIVRKAFLERQVDDAKSPLEIVFEELFENTWDRDKLSDDDKKNYIADFISALLVYRHPVVYDPTREKCITLDKAVDPELISYGPYRALFEDRIQRERLTGTIIKYPLATYIAEGWINPKTGRPRSENLPTKVRQYLHVLNEQDEDREQASEEGKQ